MFGFTCHHFWLIRNLNVLNVKTSAITFLIKSSLNVLNANHLPALFWLNAQPKFAQPSTQICSTLAQRSTKSAQAQHSAKAQRSQIAQRSNQICSTLNQICSTLNQVCSTLTNFSTLNQICSTCSTNSLNVLGHKILKRLNQTSHAQCKFRQLNIAQPHAQRSYSNGRKQTTQWKRQSSRAKHSSQCTGKT